MNAPNDLKWAPVDLVERPLSPAERAALEFLFKSFSDVSALEDHLTAAATELRQFDAGKADRAAALRVEVASILDRVAKLQLATEYATDGSEEAAIEACLAAIEAGHDRDEIHERFRSTRATAKGFAARGDVDGEAVVWADLVDTLKSLTGDR